MIDIFIRVCIYVFIVAPILGLIISFVVMYIGVMLENKIEYSDIPPEDIKEIQQNLNAYLDVQVPETGKINFSMICAIDKFKNAPMEEDERMLKAQEIFGEYRSRFENF